MRLYTSSDQTAKLIELGFDRPKFEIETQLCNIKGQPLRAATIVGDYYIGELIEMLPEVLAPSNDTDLEMPLNISTDSLIWVVEYNGGIEDIRIYGTDGSGMSQISSNVPVMIRQAMDVVSEATGVDMKDVLRASTIEAKTDRNVDVDVNGVVLPNKE